jgi:transcriptional regulator with XRE-family HTH domain
MDQSYVRTDIARRVAKALLDSDKSKTQLARVTGIPYATLDRKLRGVTDFSVVELLRVADALGITPASLVPPLFVLERVAA